MASRLVGLRTSVLSDDAVAAAKHMMRDDVLVRLRAANERQTGEFEKIRSRLDWETYRDERLAAMRRSFGPANERVLPAAGCEVTSTFEGDGFHVENLVIAGRPGLPITANLYVPSQPSTNMPGILVVNSGHSSKGQGELLEMGMTWARSGSLVLIPDNLGYGERGQQVFGGREDYRWRYYLGMQLHVAGESLMDWMVADLRRGLDVLTARAGVDPRRIIVLGSVAGGGDPAAVLAATDSRVTCVIPHNFGSAYAGKAENPGATNSVNYISGGDWDAMRCLRNSGRDGFNNWLIAAAVAPRYLIFAKEFEWQPAGDEGFARIVRVFELCNARDHLDTSHGFGQDSVRDRPRSPCNHVGIHQRQAIYPILERWLHMPVPVEYRQRPTTEQLTCLSPAIRARWNVRPVHEVLADLATQRVASARAALALLSPGERRERLRRAWAGKLGNVVPAGAPAVTHSETVRGHGYTAERILLAPEPAIMIPLLLLKPDPGRNPTAAPPPVVIGVAQEGKDAFLAKRAMELAELLARGVAVCLVDVRGTGETAPGDDRYWYSESVNLASEEFMLGETVLGSRVRDLRNVLRHLRSRPDLDGNRVAVWGESFAPVNAPKFVDPPMNSDHSALLAEPMGATAALLLALYEDDIKAVIARGGLTGYTALLDGPACHVAMDAIVPNVLAVGDLADVTASVAPLPVRMEGLVDGRNRLAGQDRIDRDFASAREAYRFHAGRLTLSPIINDDVADWLSRQFDNLPKRKQAREKK